ncbi:uncharacterized protein J3D65DRAFT_204523 [Phyllosticta citribraziliensis]|uniref:Uncharacterized protein n=1 Tax=Phyllosticta citribraziliensis TaxID=989973 RepID=A0ABR1M3L3_9PEZI
MMRWGDESARVEGGMGKCLWRGESVMRRCSSSLMLLSERTAIQRLTSVSQLVPKCRSPKSTGLAIPCRGLVVARGPRPLSRIGINLLKRLFGWRSRQVYPALTRFLATQRHSSFLWPTFAHHIGVDVPGAHYRILGLRHLLSVNSKCQQGGMFSLGPKPAAISARLWQPEWQKRTELASDNVQGSRLVSSREACRPKATAKSKRMVNDRLE